MERTCAPQPATPDEELMALVRSGSRAAFAGLIDRWGPRLLRFFRYLGADPHEADDCVQETLLRLYAYRHQYRASPSRPLAVLLFRIARNVRADILRKRMRSLDARPLLLEPEPAAGRRGAWAADDHLDLRDAVIALPEKLRAVVILNVFEGLGYEEVARALGIPRGTVKSRMFLALVRLREVLHAPSST